MAFVNKAALLADLATKWDKVAPEQTEGSVFEGIQRYTVQVFGTDSGSKRWRTVTFYEDTGTNEADYEIQNTVRDEINSFIDSAKSNNQIDNGELIVFNEEALIGYVRVGVLVADQVELSFYQVYKDKNGDWQKKQVPVTEMSKVIGAF